MHGFDFNSVSRVVFIRFSCPRNRDIYLLLLVIVLPTALFGEYRRKSDGSVPSLLFLLQNGVYIFTFYRKFGVTATTFQGSTVTVSTTQMSFP